MIPYSDDNPTEFGAAIVVLAVIAAILLIALMGD